MKIFWTWQSDTPGNVGRHFIRECLEAAIEDLRSDIDLEEADRSELHLDHDRKGVPGSPDLAKTILEKIAASAVVVADVTPVGRTSSGKALINSNVAIELGYALSVVGDSGLLMVLNQAFGTREDLPFDLSHKAGPILFTLAPYATADDRRSTQRQLSGMLRVAIRECLGAKSGVAAGHHEEMPSEETVARYFKTGEVLTERSNEQGLSYETVPLVYLRLTPVYQVPLIKRAEIKEIVFGIKLPPLKSYGGASWALNQYGGITCSAREGRLLSSTQLFLNREIWGINAEILEGGPIIATVLLEETIQQGLYDYLTVATSRLSLQGPFCRRSGRRLGRRVFVGNQQRPAFRA